MRQEVPTEHQEQCALFEWAAWMAKRIPELHLMHAIPNGGKHGLYIELKSRRGGVVSKAQEAWIRALTIQGYMCAVCHGAEAAKDEILAYMAM